MSIIGGLLVGIGVALMLLTGVGVLRMPDVLTRINAATKAAGLGVACVLSGVAFLEPSRNAFIRMGIAVALQFLTAPLAGHVLGRAAYRSNAHLWEGTVYDDLGPYYESRRTGDSAS